MYGIFYHIFRTEIPGFVNYNRLISLQACENIKMLLLQCKNIKRVWRHVLYCMQCLKFERNVFKTKENVINSKFNDFDIEGGIYFTHETGFFLHINIKKSRLTRKLNSLFNVKTWNTLYLFLIRTAPYLWWYIRKIPCWRVWKSKAVQEQSLPVFFLLSYLMMWNSPIYIKRLIQMVEWSRSIYVSQWEVCSIFMMLSFLKFLCFI